MGGSADFTISKIVIFLSGLYELAGKRLCKQLRLLFLLHCCGIARLGVMQSTPCNPRETVEKWLLTHVLAKNPLVEVDYFFGTKRVNQPNETL